MGVAMMVHAPRKVCMVYTVELLNIVVVYILGGNIKSDKVRYFIWAYKHAHGWERVFFGTKFLWKFYSPPYKGHLK